MEALFISIIIIVVLVLVLRMVGAWMLRINDVIEELKGLRSEVFAFRKQLDNYRKEDKKTFREGIK